MKKNQIACGNKDLIIEVKVKTKAKQDQVLVQGDGQLKVAIAAHPHNGKANSQLIKFLSKIFGAPQKNIKIIRGEKSKNKLISISGISK